MDRIGIFAMGAALVIVSALHMVNAPTWLVAVPTLLFVAGVMRLVFVRETDAACTPTDLASSAEI